MTLPQGIVQAPEKGKHLVTTTTGDNVSANYQLSERNSELVMGQQNLHKLFIFLTVAREIMVVGKM